MIPDRLRDGYLVQLLVAGGLMAASMHDAMAVDEALDGP